MILLTPVSTHLMKPIFEANISYPTSEFTFRWTAARILDRYGKLDYPFYASSKFRVLSDLKKSLI